MIEAINLTKNFGNLQVLKNINLKIEKGEIVSIVGGSGAGKTTLLQILGTLDYPTSGELIIKDSHVVKSKMSNSELAKFRNSNIGFIFQFHHLLPEFTALENVMIPGWIAKRKETELKNKAIEILNYLNLSHRLTHKPSEMSGGEQQRVAVARALINNPSVIFADEPSGNLDSKNASELHNLFFELRDKFNQTFVIVTHNEELANRTDRKLILKDGEF